MESVKYLLDESQIPKAWYNILADLPVPLPPRSRAAVPSTRAR